MIIQIVINKIIFTEFVSYLSETLIKLMSNNPDHVNLELLQYLHYYSKDNFNLCV